MPGGAKEPKLKNIIRDKSREASYSNLSNENKGVKFKEYIKEDKNEKIKENTEKKEEKEVYKTP